MTPIETIVQTVLQISISMAAVIGILLLLVPVWQKHYSARWRKIIWLVIAVRLLIPFSVELPAAPVQMDVDFNKPTALTRTITEEFTVETEYDYAVAPEEYTALENDAELTVMPIQSKEAISTGVILSAIWIAGMCLFMLFYTVQYYLFRRRVYKFSEALEDSEWLVQQTGSDMNLHQYPEVMLSHQIQGPMLIGFAKPVILLPDRIYEEQELHLILRHELTHYKHHDLWYKLILLAANAMHWFNPLVYLMVRQAGRDLEQVCDDEVVAGKDMGYRKAYCMTILNTMANQRGVALSTYLSKDAQNVKKRFAEILQPKQYRRGAVVFLAIVLLAAVSSGCLQFTEPVTDTKQKEDGLAEEIILSEVMLPEQQNPVSFWEYTGYLDAFPWENTENPEPFSFDYDGDGKIDRVYRSKAQDEWYYQYQIEFASGEVLKLEDSVSNVGYPQVDGVDLTGDGQNEIIFQIGYPTGTNPLACGELVVYEKQKGKYLQMQLPFEDGDEPYQQMLPVAYSKADGQAVKVSIPGTDFSQIVPIKDNALWNDYQYGSTYVTGETMQHCIWAYKIRETDGKPQLICSVQLFDKWSQWGLDIVLGCKKGELFIDEIEFCEDIYTEWM